VLENYFLCKSSSFKSLSFKSSTMLYHVKFFFDYYVLSNFCIESYHFASFPLEINMFTHYHSAFLEMSFIRSLVHQDLVGQQSRE